MTILRGTREGMGAVPYDRGTGFRVWAPHAEWVGVEGSFNNWDAAKNPMNPEDNGYWFIAINGAKPGDEYKFVIKNGKQQLHKIDPYAQEVTNSVGNGVIYDHAAYDWEGDAYQLPGHHELVIYEAHVGTFYDASGDKPGTFALAEKKLDHLVDLGVNVVQLMPVAEFAGDFSWGYNPAHIFAVESAYGGPDGLKSFIKKAHSKGLAVVIDVVYNHFGPSDLDLWQFDGWSENDKGGIYFYNDWRSSTPWGDTRPDYGRGEVRQFIRDNALMWIRDYHADGLRFDMTPYIRSVDAMGAELPDGWSLMRWVNEEVQALRPGALTVAEDMQGNPKITGLEDDDAGFSAQWDGRFVHPIREAIITYNDYDRSIGEVAEAASLIYDADAFRRVIYTESHDEVANGQARVVNEINPHDEQGWYAQKRSTIGAALVMTSPGIPMLFQGQEFLEGGWFRDTVPVDWSLDKKYQGITRLYRDLIQLRRDWHSTTKGLKGHGVSCYHQNNDAKVMAMHRWSDGGPGDDVVVVINLSAEPHEHYRIGMPASGLWKLRFNSDSTDYSSQFGGFASFDADATGEGQDGQPASAEVSVGPYSVLIYSQDQA